MADIVHSRDALSPESVEEQLARVLASSQFSGTEVFGRPENFDPRLDTIVRVQASNLRRRLADYYANGGANDQIVIALPRGSYVPSIHARNSPPEVQHACSPSEPPLTSIARHGIRPEWAAIVAAIILIGVAIYWALPGSRGDGFTLQAGVAILPFANLSEDPAKNILVTA